MKKAWPYVVTFLVGSMFGTLATLSIVKNDINKTEITYRKILQKRNTDSILDIRNTITRQEQRKERKRLRKATN